MRSTDQKRSTGEICRSRTLFLGFLFTDHDVAEIRDFLVDLLKGVFRELLGGERFFFKLAYVLLCAFDYTGRQRSKNLVHRFDFGLTMAKHHDIVPGLETEANGIV